MVVCDRRVTVNLIAKAFSIYHIRVMNILYDTLGITKVFLFDGYYVF